MRQKISNYQQYNALGQLKRSLAFYSDWINWNMDDSTQKNVSVEWSQLEDAETNTTCFVAEFFPDKGFANGLEDGDMLRVDYKEDGANISIWGVASPVMISQDTNNNININNGNTNVPVRAVACTSDKTKTQEMKVQIKFPPPEGKKRSADERNIRFCIDSLADVTIVNVGLFNNYRKQKKAIGWKIRELDLDKFLCEVLCVNSHKDDDDKDENDDGERKSKLNRCLPNIDEDNKLRQQVILDNMTNRNFELNESQKTMIQHALNNRITLVMGPPGTGKTFTSAVLACNLHETRMKGKDSKILVCASSNVAVDNLAMAIHKLNVVNVIRIRSHRNEKHDNTQSFHLDRIMKTSKGEPFDSYHSLMKREKKLHGKFFCLDKSEELCKLEYQCEQIILGDADVICCTCSGSTRLENFRIEVDSLIIDECSQVTVPEGLLPIQFNPKRIILVGDDNQLGPVIKDRYAEKYCDDNLVLYSKLKMTGFVPKMLDMQYRMHPELVKFANEEFYEGRIKSGVGHDERRWTDLKHKCPFPIGCTPIYFQCHICHETKDHNSTSRHNIGEINIVIDTIKVLLSRGVQSKAIGVITPYSDQCKLIIDKLKKITRESRFRDKGKNNKKWVDNQTLAKCTEVEVATVDAYQGREKDYIIVSFVRSSMRGGQNLAFIADKRRLNVTLTRAKYGMIIIGNPIGMESEPLLERFIKDLSDRHLLYAEVLSEISKPVTLEQFESKYSHLKKQPPKIEVTQIQPREIEIIQID